jgi:type IV pilus assembly protein PilA
MKLNKKKLGFTLIELLIVVAIVGVLILVGTPYYNKYIQSSEINSSLTSLNFYRTSIAVCLQTKVNQDVCNGGSSSIPKDFSDGSIKGIKSIETKKSIINVVSGTYLPELNDYVKIKYKPLQKESVIVWEISCSDYELGTIVDNCSSQY